MPEISNNVHVTLRQSYSFPIMELHYLDSYAPGCSTHQPDPSIQFARGKKYHLVSAEFDYRYVTF